MGVQVTDHLNELGVLRYQTSMGTRARIFCDSGRLIQVDLVTPDTAEITQLSLSDGASNRSSCPVAAANELVSFTDNFNLWQWENHPATTRQKVRLATQDVLTKVPRQHQKVIGL